MVKPNILLANPIHKDAISFLREKANLTEQFGISHDTLLECITKYDAIITRSDNAITPTILDAGKKLRVIGRAAIGTDNIDIACATQKNIAVVNAPTGNCKAAAEHTIGLIFALARHIPSANTDLKQGIWGKHKYIGMQLEGKTLGIIGMGRVGSHVARIARAIGLEVIYYDPFITTQNATPVSFEKLLKTADIVTLHTPHTRLTDRLIDMPALTMMKSSAFLINCARGKVVDEQALITALESKQIAGAALDVYEKEPLIESPLQNLPNVILTPHIGGSTEDAQRATGMEVASGVLSVLTGVVPPNVLNPEIYEKQIKALEGINTIIFDCDSTLVSIEGIDELARMKGVEAQIIPLTEKAMNGELKPEKVFKKRLDIIQPTQKELIQLGELYISSLLPNTKAVISLLKKQGTAIYIISGGYDIPVQILADYLGISKDHVCANKLTFTKKGTYLALDETVPLWKEKGKSQVIRKIQRSGKTVLIGDGVTDLEAKSEVDLFIGFGGIKKRELLKKNSDIYLELPTLTPLLHIAKNSQTRHNLVTPAERKLLMQGVEVLLDPVSTVFKNHEVRDELIKKLLE